MCRRSLSRRSPSALGERHAQTPRFADHKSKLIPSWAWRWLAIVVAVGAFYLWAHGRGVDQGKAQAGAAYAKIEAARAKAQADADAERDKRQAQAEEDQAKRNADFAAKSQAAAQQAAALNTKIAMLVAKQKAAPECDAPAEDRAALNEQISFANAQVGNANANVEAQK